MITQPAQELSLCDIISHLPAVDIVLTEGYKKSNYPKIEIHRAELNAPLLASEDQLLAIMTDEPLSTAVRQIPLEDISRVC